MTRTAPSPACAAHRPPTRTAPTTRRLPTMAAPPLSAARKTTRSGSNNKNSGTEVPPFVSLCSLPTNLNKFLGCQRRDRHSLGLRADDLHLLPVIGQFLAAVQAHHVGSRNQSSRVASASLYRDRKTVTVMPAA